MAFDTESIGVLDSSLNETRLREFGKLPVQVIEHGAFDASYEKAFTSQTVNSFDEDMEWEKLRCFRVSPTGNSGSCDAQTAHLATTSSNSNDIHTGNFDFGPL